MINAVIIKDWSGTTADYYIAYHSHHCLAVLIGHFHFQFGQPTVWFSFGNMSANNGYIRCKGIPGEFDDRFLGNVGRTQGDFQALVQIFQVFQTQLRNKMMFA